MIELIQNSFYELYLILSNLILVGSFFFLIGFLFKGNTIFLDIKKAAKSTRFNLVLMVLNIFILAPIFMIVVTIHSTISLDFAKLFWSEMNMLFVTFSAIFIGDFIGYWRHRFEHSRLLWPFHAVHHSDETMTWLTLQRFHPVNRVSTYLIDIGLLILLGFPAYAIMANTLIRHYYGYFIHANLPWNYGIMGKVFVSPVMHRWHHAFSKDAYDTNFATVFAIFDLAFGTYRVPPKFEGELGVQSHKKLGLVGQLIYPLKKSSYKISSSN